MQKLIVACICIILVPVLQTVSAAEKLQNVTGGNTVRGIITSHEATGEVRMSWDDTETRLTASFSNLTTPSGDDFYEGWLVRKSPFSMVSTGRVNIVNGEYTNFFSSPQNFSSYTHFVLTIEANDANADAGKHILEWKAVRVADVQIVNEEVLEDANGEIIELTDSQKSLVIRIEARLANVSALQRIALLERVLAFQNRLPNLQLDEATKQRYTEILQVLVYVLS